MGIIGRRAWEADQHQITPEHLAMNRRGLLAGAAALATLRVGSASAAEAVPRNPKFVPGRPITDEKYATTYNNYYEFNESKNIWRQAQALKQRPWTIRLEGMMKQPRTIDVDDLLKQVQLEERVYRHRCVEAWSMVVPWTYIEGLTMAEAANELTFISTGLYGKPLPPQNGGPIRLTVPWKYGFKSAKALTKISFTDKRPMNFWQAIAPSEYGFWANVNPAVAHPRWSQAQERVLGTDEMVPTVIYNGYGEYVAGLYSGIEHEKLFM